MKTTTNKKGKTSARDILRMKNYFNYLELNEYDKDLFAFFNYNFNFFSSKPKKDLQVGLTVNKYIKFIDKKNESTFEVEFIPDMIKPTRINVSLSNLEGHLSQIYTIIFDEFDDLTTIIHRKYQKGFSDEWNKNSSVLKSTTKRIYDENALLIHEVVNENYISSSVFDDSSYSKVEDTYFDRYSDDYVKYTSIVGEASSHYEDGSSYVMFDGKEQTRITKAEYDRKVENYTIYYPKVKLIDSIK